MTPRPAKRQSFVPPDVKLLSDTLHFTPAVRVGDMIWVSGQVGLTEAMQPADGMEAQARLAFEALQAVLVFAGSSLADVVEFTTFHTDLCAEIDEFMKVKDKYFAGHYPAWTAVGVAELGLPGLCLEMRAVAVAGSGST
ncbi:RidA family protein [Sphingopyxis sp.]|uniref:RidA family protein n=1 Tax=Sphingopyxis sp. TaxID=1908224 RepID=UPI003D6C7BFA